MYNPGGDYLTYIKDSIIRKPRSKIVVDGKTYTGLEHLVSFPKITHETEKMIGGFPAKTCEFEIYNLDGKLSLNGKEVQVYRGLDISDTKTVWIPMGLFYADGEDVTNNSTKRTIQFKGTDRTRLFDSPFANVYSKGIIPADTVISTVAEKICAKHGLSINTATKSKIISYRFTEAVGTPEDTTDRQVIAWIAELSGCIPIISRDGQSLMFTRPSYKETVTEAGKTYPSGSYADKRKYKTLSAEPLYGPINAISFGHADYDDAYVYQDDTDVETNGLHEWKINDNALAENDKSALAPKVFAIIKGMQIYPFELTDFIDDYLFDINDGIQIKKKDGAFVTTYVLGMNTTSRIRSTFKAGTQDSSAADRNLAGSVKSDMKKIKLSVDHINNQITVLVKESDERYSEFTQTAKGLEGTIADVEKGLEAKIEATAKSFELTYAKKETVDGQIEGITNQIGTINTELAGIDGKIEGKVTTEVQKDTTIAILAGKVESKISGNYVTKATYDDEKKNWLLKTTYDSYVSQTDQKISAAVSRVQTLETAGYITKAACNSLIDQKSDSIALKVESSIKTESRNLLKNSACFENFTTNTYNSYFDGFESGTNPYVAKDQTTLPSGQAQRILFMSNNETVSGFKYAGSAFVEAALGSKNAGNVLKPKTTYTLSFWARMYDSGTKLKNRATLNLANAVYTGTGANSVTIDSTRSRGASLTNSFSKVVIVFTTGGAIETFQLNFRLEGIPVGYVAGIIFSSLKLEVGNIATDWTEWTPTAADVEQSAQAKIDMCVQKDKNNNLVSEINIASNLLTIDTDNFTLAKDGTMSCTGATITGGTILCGDTNTSMLIAQGAIVHKFDGTEIGQIGLTMNPDSSGNMQYYERISGTVGVQISANNYATFVDDAGFVVCSNARDTTINVSISSTTDWSYASYSSALRSIVEADAALIVSANRGNNNLYLEGSSVVICGQLEALNDVKLRTAIGLSSSQSYVYVVADKKTGEIGYLSA